MATVLPSPFTCYFVIFGQSQNEFFVERFSKHEFTCSICHKPIELENAQADDYGDTVHEECYVLRLVLKRHSDQPTQSIKSVKPIRPPAA
jgi:hypothetical protein